jgi:hypothetical protein
MRNASIVITVLGTIALVLAVVGVLFHIKVLDIPPAGYIRGATAVYLLALICIAYGGCCCCCKEDKKKK